MNTNQEKLTKAIARERKHIKNKSRNLLFTSIISIVVLLALWELSVQLGWITTRFFCAPSEVLNALIEKLTNRAPDGATLPVHILSSMKISMIGFLMAVLIGTPLGLLMGWYKAAVFWFWPISDRDGSITGCTVFSVREGATGSILCSDCSSCPVSGSSSS